MTSNIPLRFGVIGAGRIGKIHAENLATRIPGVEVVAIADPVARRATNWPPACMSQATADYKELLADPTINAVAICSSTDTHAPI